MLGKNCDDAAISALQAYPHGMQIGGIISMNTIVEYLHNINGNNDITSCAEKALIVV